MQHAECPASDATAVVQSDFIRKAARNRAVDNLQAFTRSIPRKVSYTFLHALTLDSGVKPGCTLSSKNVVGQLKGYFNGQIDSAKSSLTVTVDLPSLSFSVQGTVAALGGVMDDQAPEFAGPVRIMETKDVLAGKSTYRAPVRYSGQAVNAVAATMSSTAASDGLASNCMDGKTGDTTLACRSVAEQDPWLELDMGAETAVVRVVIHNRKDECKSLLTGGSVCGRPPRCTNGNEIGKTCGVLVRVGNARCAGDGNSCSPKHSTTLLCGTATDNGSEAVEVLCPVAIKGRYVQVLLPSQPGKARVINVHEVSVFSAPNCSPPWTSNTLNRQQWQWPATTPRLTR